MRRAGLVWSGLAVLLLFGCRGAGPLPRPGVPRPAADLRGKLQLIDGTAVPGARLTVTCGPLQLRARSDSAGRFTLRGVPEGRCRVTCPAARVDQIIRASRNLLGDTDLVVTVPPMHRMRIEHEQAVQEVDETLAAWTPTLLQRGTLLQKTARAWMPLALRGAPRGWEIKRIPLLGPDGQLITLDLSAPRTAVYLAPCGKRAARVAQRLQQLVEDHAVTGLRGVTILPRVCPGQTPRPPHTLGGSAEVLWALQAHPGDLVVLDRTGAVMHRAADLDDAVAYLERSWPPFAAVRQVSVRPATSVRDAAAQRLYTRASREFRARRYAEAHGLLDQTIALDPEHAEAHRERALLKARLGDISGAMREVTWWRSSFGEESAEDLLDEIQRVTAAR